MNDLLDLKYSVIAVVGEHAGESLDDIFNRKKNDINRIGSTFWVDNSRRTKPDMIQNICRKRDVYIYFIEPASKGGAVATKNDSSLEYYSKDGAHWQKISSMISTVAGSKKSHAVIITDLITNMNEHIDLWNYADFFNPNEPIKFILGMSSVCAIKKYMGNHKSRIKSHHRRLLAMGKICKPFGVWLK